MVCTQVQKMEAELRYTLFPPNAWMKGLHFNILTSCPKDKLHQCFLRLNGEYIIPAIVLRYTKVVAAVRLKLYEPSPVPTLNVGRLEDLLGRVPLSPCFLDGNTTSTIPHKYAPRQKQAFKFGCADGSVQGFRSGSHVYEINAWLWNFGRPPTRIGGLSVA